MSATGVIDLRSDTVTRPSPGMLQAMTSAPLGDDVLGDDPTVQELQAMVADLLGKEAACFVPSGTMANQTAIRAHTEPGDEVVCHANSHIIHYETGAPAALSGVMIAPLAGPRGFFEAADVEAAVRSDYAAFARSRLLVVENTNNRGGGSVWPLEKIRQVTAAARKHGLRTHLDGARLWNACAATGIHPRQYAAEFDTVSVCFSKGLGTPVGSAVVGTREVIHRVVRARKMFGGAMRQSGILAAAAIYALKNNRERMVRDHANARSLAQGLAGIRGLKVDAADVETNMVFFDLEPSLAFNAAELMEKVRARGVWMMATAPRRIRAVTHLDIADDMVPRAVAAVASCVG